MSGVIAMKEFWEERYGKAEYAYGVNPNEFLKEVLKVKEPGRILLPAEGEGRNAVYAAICGWDVEAFDYSAEGHKKAHDLARNKKVKLSYSIHDYNSFVPTNPSFDLIALIYTHTDPETRRAFNQKVIEWLAPGGEVILEGFSKQQLGRSSGGPKNVDMLWSKDELENEFRSLQIEYSEEVEVTLSEGPYHQGIAAVVRFRGRNSL